MKYFLFFLFCFPIVCLAQEWELYADTIDGKVKYEYELKPNFQEPSEFKVLKSIVSESQTIIQGQVVDFRDSSLSFATVSIKTLVGDSTIAMTISDFDGKFSLSTLEKEFLIEAEIYDQFEKQVIEVKNKEHLKITYGIKLGRILGLDRYVLISEKPVSDEILKTAIECIKPLYYFNPNEIYNCDEGQDYWIAVRL